MNSDFRIENMHLGVFLLGAYKTKQFWRHPNATPDTGINFKYNLEIAQKAQDATFDFVFVADLPYSDASSPLYLINRFEPVTLLSALSSVTDDIGLIGTMSSTYTDPFNTARQILSLDHLCNGRAGCNIVTSMNPNVYKNFSKEDSPSREERYNIADEYIEVVKKLWRSWGHDSLLYNKESGKHVDTTKVNPINHTGKYFSVKGPLNIHRSVQDTPLLFHAGVSEESMRLAARHTDMIFTWSKSFDSAVEFYSQTKSMLPAFGRSHDDLLIFHAVDVLIVDNDSEIPHYTEEMLNLENITESIEHLSSFFKYDFSACPLDEPFPEACRFSPNINNPIYSKFLDNVYSNKMTLREVASMSTAPFSAFHGTPETVANKMQHWFENNAADGFILSEFRPGSLFKFMDAVVPILKTRGILKESYTGKTLRENLNLEHNKG